MAVSDGKQNTFSGSGSLPGTFTARMRLKSSLRKEKVHIFKTVRYNKIYYHEKTNTLQNICFSQNVIQKSFSPVFSLLTSFWFQRRPSGVRVGEETPGMLRVVLLSSSTG